MSEIPLRVALDSDPAGHILKNALLQHLIESGVSVEDVGYDSSDSAPYPEIAFHLAYRIQSGEFDRGILICGTGLGMAIAANKVEGVYAGVCHDVYSAERLQKSNNAQVLTLGARVIGVELAKAVVDKWLASQFQGGASTKKVKQLSELEHRSFTEMGLPNQGDTQCRRS